MSRLISIQPSMFPEPEQAHQKVCHAMIFPGIIDRRSVTTVSYIAINLIRSHDSS